MEQLIQERTNHGSRNPIEFIQLEENPQSRGRVHACKASQRTLQWAEDRLKRANRDLGETAAFMLGLMTTVTAIEAVINIADNKIHISSLYLQIAFDVYVVVFLLILFLGGLRSFDAIHRRSQAEKEIDHAKKGIFDYCPEEQWPKFEE